MAHNKYVIVDNYDELTAVEGRHPGLKQAPLILLSDSFNLEQLASFNGRGYQYFDDAISDDEAKTMSAVIHNILWDWFRDEEGNDLSLINGLSLGITFSGSMEILLNSIIKYEVGLANILKMGDEVIYVSYTDDIFLSVIDGFKDRIGLVVNVVNIEGEHQVVLHGKQKLKLDPGARKRDLGPYFKIDRRAAFIHGILKTLRKLRAVDPGKGRVLLFSAGKMNEFMALKAKDSHWILPFSSLKDLWLMLSGKICAGSRFIFSATNNGSDEKTEKVVSALANNLCRIRAINHKTLLDLMRKYVFNYADSAVSFYKNASEEIAALRPDLAIISTDVIEPHLIVAQAAKNAGIKTALLPHGIDDWGHKELRSGPLAVIDYCLAYGTKHVMDNIDHGIPPEGIKTVTFPYFSRFIPMKENQPSNYRKALILTPDYVNISPGSKYGYFFRYLNDLSRMLKGIKMEIVGIKSRGDYDHLFRSIKEGFMVIGGEKIRWFTGYSSFPEIAGGADLVIGNSSTALIEAGLMGIDYYVIYPELEYSIPSLSRNVDKIMHSAHSIDELRDNILNRRVYRSGYTVKDYVDLVNVKTKEDLYRKFEAAVLSVANVK